MMNHPPSDPREQIALFRYGLIADIKDLARGERGLYARLREKAQRDYAIPGSRRTRVASETIRGWLRQWRDGAGRAKCLSTPSTRQTAICSW